MLTPSRPLVEVAVDSVASAVAAAGLGAGRLELCQSLELGGLTPSLGLVETVAPRVSLPVFVMIRPRAGGFRYVPDEVSVMVRDTERSRAAGAAGVVIGALTAADQVDAEVVARLVEAAGGLPVTFHRAIDRVPAWAPALEVLISAGVTRILTSGGAATAWLGRSAIEGMVRQAAGRLTVMAGGGVTGEHAAELARLTGIGEIHLSGVRLDDTAPDQGFGRASGPDRARLQAVMAALV